MLYLIIEYSNLEIFSGKLANVENSLIFETRNWDVQMNNNVILHETVLIIINY